MFRGESRTNYSEKGPDPTRLGRLFERDMFGVVEKNDPSYRHDLEQAITDPKTGYVPYQKALDLVRNHQPGDPTNPKTDMLREMVIGVQEKLGLTGDETDAVVRGLTAVGTPLDFFHGTDALIEFERDGRRYQFTLDASLREDKESKADLVIGDMPSPEENESAYLDRIEKYAEAAAEALRRQIATDAQRRGATKIN